MEHPIVCGRINLRATPKELAEFFDLFREPEWTPRYNLGPLQQILVIRKHPDGVRLAEPMQWGLVPAWSKDRSMAAHMINARADTVAEKPAYREAIVHRRCLIPVSGFFEWQIINSKTKQPWHLYRADEKPFAFAGLWEHWQSPEGHILESCAVITTETNQALSDIHTRMPVVLSPEVWSIWLTEQELDTKTRENLLAPYSNDGWKKVPVSTLVNSVKNDSSDCLNPVRPPLTLF